MAFPGVANAPYGLNVGFRICCRFTVVPGVRQNVPGRSAPRGARWSLQTPAWFAVDAPAKLEPMVFT